MLLLIHSISQSQWWGTGFEFQHRNVPQGWITNKAMAPGIEDTVTFKDDMKICLAGCTT